MTPSPHTPDATDTAPDLHALHQEIDARVGAIRASHADWPCARGCGGCCQRLADAPRLSRAEWTLLRAGLRALPASQLARIARDVAALGPQPVRPVLCPMLNPASQACLVYPHRPVACRTYGFYSERVLGLYCDEIEAGVANGRLSDVIWGNHDAVERRLDALGERRSLVAWFADDAGFAHLAEAEGTEGA